MSLSLIYIYIYICLKLQYLLKTRSVYVNILSEGLPWYNHNRWLGIKHQVTYLLWVMVSSAIFDLTWDENKWFLQVKVTDLSKNFIFLVSLHIRQTEREQTTTKMLMCYCSKWATNRVTNRLTWQKMSFNLFKRNILKIQKALTCSCEWSAQIACLIHPYGSVSKLSLFVAFLSSLLLDLLCPCIIYIVHWTVIGVAGFGCTRRRYVCLLNVH